MQWATLLVAWAGCLPLLVALPAGADSTPAVKRALIVTGQDHPGHKWRLTAPVLADAIGADPRIEVDTVEDPAVLARPDINDYDVIVLHFMDWEQPAPGPEARANLKGFVEGGKGLVLVHFACGAFQDWPEFGDLAGRVWDPNLRAHDPFGEFRVDITDTEHPITRGLESFQTVDELYTCLAGDLPVDMLATARSKVDGKDYPMAFAFSCGKGRVFHSPLGHDVGALANPHVAELFRRGCAWTALLPPVPDQAPAAAQLENAPSPVKAVIIAGKPSHSEGEHDWDEDANLVKHCLDTSPNAGPIKTEVHLNGWPEDPGVLDDADTIVFLSDGLGSHPLAAGGRIETIHNLTDRGCGLVCLHYAVAPPEGKEEEFLELIGGYWEKDYSKNPISTTEVSPGAPDHPICRGAVAFTARDEFYYRIRFREDDERLVPIMTAMLPKNDPALEVVAWALERTNGARGFGSTGGHFHENWRSEPFRKMLLNAILWTAKANVPQNGVQSSVE